MVFLSSWDNWVFCRRSQKKNIQKIPKSSQPGIGYRIWSFTCKDVVFTTPLMSWACQFQTPNCCEFCCCCCCCSCNARTVQDFQFMAEERVETGGGTDLDRWIYRHRSRERVGGGRICNRSWPLDLVAQRSGDLESGKWVGWLVVAALCTNLDRWIPREGVGNRLWWRDSTQISTVGFCCQKISRGVVRQVGNGLVVAGEAAQIVTVGFVAEDLERERVGQLVGGRIDLDRWICWQRSISWGS